MFVIKVVVMTELLTFLKRILEDLDPTFFENLLLSQVTQLPFMHLILAVWWR